MPRRATSFQRPSGWKGLAGYDVIYLGEEHHNRSHIESRADGAADLVTSGRRPVLAMDDVLAGKASPLWMPISRRRNLLARNFSSVWDGNKTGALF